MNQVEETDNYRACLAKLSLNDSSPEIVAIRDRILPTFGFSRGTDRAKVIGGLGLSGFEVWSIRIPSPKSQKGSRSGYRLICLRRTSDDRVFLDYLNRRDLMDKNPHKNNYQSYLSNLKNRSF